MTTAAAAAELKSNIGPDFNLSDAYDAAYIDTQDVEDVDLMTVEQRQAVNVFMAEYFNG
jgi:hypothetical protein